MLGSILASSKAEGNSFKKRILKAGLGEGVNFPDNFDSLSEDEQEKRLDGAIQSLK